MLRREWPRAQERGLRHLHGCVREYKRRCAARRDGVEQPEALAPPAKEACTPCFKIREVLGIDMCVAANPRQKRAGCKAGDDNISYKVRGGFGEDKDDELVPETRWVKLSDLVFNMSDSSLASLDKWAGKLQKAAQEARKRTRVAPEGAEDDD